ncbi:MAG TPA: RHS repeat-associated core domain-containing protein [Terriglobales bacterium]
MISGRQAFWVAVILFVLCFASFGQLPTGTPVFGSFDSDGVNTINLGTLNIHTQIPIFSRPGKGISFSVVLNHDNVFWYPSGGRWLYATNGSSTGLDWVGLAPASQGAPAGYTVYPAICSSKQGTLVYSNWSYLDVFNTTHGTPVTLDSAGCIYGTSGNGTSADGYALSASVSQGTITGVGPNLTTIQSSGAGWSNLGNIKYDDSPPQFAIYTPGLTMQQGGDYSTDLQAKGFGFNIPLNASITGVKVEIDRQNQTSLVAAANIVDNDVTLLRAGTPVGNNYAAGSWPKDLEAIQTYGGSTDMWGVALTPADVNNPNFGVQVSARTPTTCTNTQNGNCGNTGAPEVDQIRMTVYYAIPTASATVTSPSGMSLSSGSYTDPHGNKITVSGTSTLNYYDTLNASAPVLAKTGSPASGLETYTYCGGSSGGPACAAGGNGSNVSFTVHYTNYTLQTNFGCPGVGEYSQANFPLATSITLPDGNTYNMAYEATPGNANATTGRLAYIQLPTLGIISYTYTGANNGINCADGSAMGFTKQTPDTSGTQWTYSRAITGYGSQLTVTSPAPDSNVTVINFDSAGHELQRQIKQGSSTLLKTVITCYNSAAIANCPTQGPTTAISSIQTYTQIPDASGIQSEVNTSFNTIALPTEVDTYDWGASTPTTSVVTAYGSWTGSCAAVGSNIQDHICYRTTHSGTNSGTIIANQVFSYNSTGDLTSTSDWVAGSAWLPAKTYTYDNYGVLQTAKGINGATNTYSNFYCNGAFPGKISSTAVSWATSQAWDCNGGVKTSVTDGNNHTVNYTYTDPFWRVTSVGDTLSTTTTTYTSATQTESVLNIGTSSTVDTLTTLDVLGRVNWVQKKQSPSATMWDSVGHFYDSNGRENQITAPGSCASGGCSGLPVFTKAYDALGRLTSYTDANSPSATTTYSYTKNDVLITSPTPAVSKQLEYNALGQLTSVCEITSSGSGNGPCGQTNSQTGYWTTYAYSPLYLSTVTQNAQASTKQIRTFTYDGVGRMISENNPESGTVTYSYDSLANDSACGSPSFIGDLVKRVDKANNATCYAYDGLHRLTNEGNTTVSSSIGRYFIYDSATVNSAAMSNAIGRIAEAYTAVASNPSTKITDEGFGYDIRGEMTDLYQSTPNSGGYYHSTASYYVNGALSSLSPGIGGSQVVLPWNYALDGEGRMYSSSNSNGAILSSTYYNSAGQVTAVTGSSGDNDAYQYDNDGRMKQYTFNIGATPTVVSGSANWNPNGTVSSLTISDGFVSANNQSCSYGYDDLSRVASVNCTSGTTNVWNQNFAYDAYGNVTKTVPTGGTGISFQPGYNNNNQYTSLPGLSYDGNGNLLADSFHTYAWDPNWGNPSTIDSTTMTYDALGRMVEYQNGTTIKQVMYGPTGKVAIMNGQTEVTSLQPFPASGVLVHRPGSQTNLWRHPDWLGSSRFASTEPGRGKFFDVGYAPFGEDYGDSGTKDLYFTGQEQDTTTSVGGLYDFSAREYAPRQGRWISPDPAGMKAADMTDPQSWNRYAYVSNSPLSVTDPSGLCPYCDHDYGHYMAVESTHSMECGFWCTGYNGTGASYTLDGMPVSAQVAQGWLSSGAAVVCQQCRPGQIVDANGTIWGNWGTYVPHGTTTSNNGFTIHTGNGWTAVGTVSTSWSESFLVSFITDFPSNFKSGSCFMQFLSNSLKNFAGVPGIDTVTGATAAHYGLSQSMAKSVPNTRVARGGISPRQWLEADEAARLSNSAKFGLWFNADVAMGQALFQKEIPAALSSGGLCQ